MGSKNNIYSTANFTDCDLKDQGNRLFSVRKYDDAIGCYTKAIVSRKFIRSSKMYDTDVAIVSTHR